MTATRLILIPAMATEPAPFLIVSPNGTVIERGALSLDAAAAPERMPTVAVAPGADVTVVWLVLPRGTAAQTRAAAAWALRDSLATAPERLSLAMGPPVPDGEPRMVAIVGQSLLLAWLDYLEALGIRPDAIVPDMLTVAEPEDADALTMVAFGPNMALRGRRFAATVQPDLVDAVAGGRHAAPADDERAVERMLAAAGLNPPLDLLGEARRQRATGSWRRTAVLAGLAMVAPLLLVAAAAARDAIDAGRMRETARAEIWAAAPDASRANDPVAEVRRRARTAPPPGGVTAAAAALFAAVESVDGAEVDMLTFDADGGVRATISYLDHADLGAMKRVMSRAGLRMEDAGAMEDDGRVVSDVVIGAAT